ncbi:hypothetical protein F5882DRAFT_486565 [Hyaloscypha sp. PMI_1271]|nr:hypothetical protein F5882DRAFT_486565 [Hyaloscypha sp. PMI_1271]
MDDGTEDVERRFAINKEKARKGSGGWVASGQASAVAKRFPCVEVFPDMYSVAHHSAGRRPGPGTCSRQWSGEGTGADATHAAPRDSSIDSGLENQMAHGQDNWTIGQLDNWTIGQLDIWTSEDRTLRGGVSASRSIASNKWVRAPGPGPHWCKPPCAGVSKFLSFSAVSLNLHCDHADSLASRIPLRVGESGHTRISERRERQISAPHLASRSLRSILSAFRTIGTNTNTNTQSARLSTFSRVGVWHLLTSTRKQTPRAFYSRGRTADNVPQARRRLRLWLAPGCCSPPHQSSPNPPTSPHETGSVSRKRSAAHLLAATISGKSCCDNS